MRSTRPLAAALALVLAAAALPGIVPPASEPARSAEAAAAQPVTAVAVPTIDLSPIVGTSGNLRAIIGLPTSFAADGRLAPLLAGRAIDDPGVHALGLTAPDGDSLVAAFERIPTLYIADGHHRAASAARARHDIRQRHRGRAVRRILHRRLEPVE